VVCIVTVLFKVETGVDYFADLAIQAVGALFSAAAEAL